MSKLYYIKYRNNQSIYYRYQNLYLGIIFSNEFKELNKKIKQINDVINNLLNIIQLNFTINNLNTKILMKLYIDIKNNPSKSTTKILIKFLQDLKLQYKYYLEKKQGCCIYFYNIKLTFTEAINLYNYLYGGYNIYLFDLMKYNNIFKSKYHNLITLLTYLEYAKETYNNYYYGKSYVNNYYNNMLLNLI